MILSEHNKQLTIFIENDLEWLEMFDAGQSNIITIDMNRKITDFFFPNLPKYINDDDLEQRMIDDANRFDTILLLVCEGVMNKAGEGEFEVKNVTFYFYNDEDNKKFVLPLEEDYIGIIAFEVTPDLYKA